MMSLKYSIVGCGNISDSHLTAAKTLEKEGLIKIVACCDTVKSKAETQAKKYGGKPYTDFDEMLKKEKPNIVDVCTFPHSTHRDIAIKSMEAGADVLCEKSMAGTIEQALDMIESSKMTGKKLMISYNYRYLTNTMKLHELIEKGELGEIRLIKAACHWWQGTHTIDLMRFLGGEVLKVCGAEFVEDRGVLISSRDNIRFGPVPNTAACIKYENGALGTLTISLYPDGGGCYFRFDVIGTKTNAIANGNGEWGTLSLNSFGRHEEVDVEKNDQSKNDWFYRDMKSFVKSVMDDEPVPISGLDGLRAMQIQIAIQRSAIEGKWIDPKTINSGKESVWILPSGKETNFKMY